VNESLLGTPNIADNLLPMRILPLEQTVCSPQHLQGLLGAYKGSKYLMALQPAQSIPWWNVQVRSLCACLLGLRMEGGQVCLSACLQCGGVGSQLAHTPLSTPSSLYLLLKEVVQSSVLALPSGCTLTVLPTCMLCCCALYCQQERCMGQYKSVQHIAVCLQSGAKPRDILTAVLEAAYMRRQLQQDFREQQQLDQQQQQQDVPPHLSSSKEDSKQPHLQQLQVQPLQVDSDAVVCSSRLRKQARSRAEANVDRFMRELSAGGWQVRPFLLSTTEKSGFVKY
jgi:hypothetical protein